jgi:hypothetical protein
MNSNSKGSAHIGCGCERCRTGLNAEIRAAKERAARHAWNIKTKYAIRENQDEDLILSKSNNGYTD